MSEIRHSLQRRLEKQGSNKMLIGSDSNSNSSQSEILVRSRDAGQLSSNNAPEFEMSELSSLSNEESWGGVSNAESLHSEHFKMKAPITSLQK